jgi:hypothetical protein
MSLRKIMGLFVCTLILGVASFASAGVPDLGNSDATMPNYAGGEVVSLFNLPSGGGKAFAEARTASGVVVDATIEVVLRDGNDLIIAGFPGEDLWLESGDGGMVACVGGTTADGDTDANGITSWVNSLNASGFSTALCYIMVSGDALTSVGSEMALQFNSADINADGVVNLTDIGQFAGYFGVGNYGYAADFQFDGIINLSDIGLLAIGLGASCP